MNKTTPLKVNGRVVNMNISAEKVFRRALGMAEKSLDVSLAAIMSRPTG